LLRVYLKAKKGQGLYGAYSSPGTMASPSLEVHFYIVNLSIVIGQIWAYFNQNNWAN